MFWTEEIAAAGDHPPHRASEDEVNLERMGSGKQITAEERSR